MIGLIISFGAGVFFGAFIMSACVLAGRKDKDQERRFTMAVFRVEKTRDFTVMSNQTGNNYDATVILADTGGKYVNYRLEFDKPKRR